MVTKGLIICQLFWVFTIQPITAQHTDTEDYNFLLLALNDKSEDDKEKYTLTSVEDEEDKSFFLNFPEPYNSEQINFYTDKLPLPDYLNVDDNYKIDCVWVKKYDYFKIWETNKLNPYGFNGEFYQDSVKLTLAYNNEENSWHPPLDKSHITSDFGLRRAVWHYGVDFRVKVGTPVYSVFDGVVRIAGYDRRGFGRFVVIRHKNGLETLYAHLSKFNVQLAQEVKAGDIIGKGGNTGRSTAPHLHFEIRYSGNAIDPNEMFDFSSNGLKHNDYVVNHDSFAYLGEANKIRYHVIRGGDTLSGLSYRYGVSVNKMCRINGISKKSILRIGQRVRIN